MSPNDGSVNNWMEYLDESTPLGSMSIPAYDFTKADDKLSEDQLLDKIKMLWNKGVRVFFVSNILDHNSLSSQISTCFNTLIDANKNEFIFILANGYHDLGVVFDNDDISLNKDNWKDMPISNLKGKIIAFEEHGGSFIQDGNLNIPRYDLFKLSLYQKGSKIFPNDDNWNEREWNAHYISTGASISEQISLNKDLHGEISAYIGQTGYTGIVAVPLADENYVNGQYTYSDLLIQSIIDCNFKFRH